MKHYIVGGAVRDRLLGLPVKDRDWVVVGATPEDMLAQGFRPVGKDFPVFLHPQTREEYALARTERKSGRGYHGFVFHAAPDVTLEQDLVRRDLTINAIAQDQDGSLIDPHGGRADLKAGLLRHVSPAFAEDPVRILRVARFAARFGFAVAAETQQLMCDMVAAGEVDALVAERVWQELAKGLMCAQPSTMLHVLRRCGALVRLLPELDALFAAGDDGVGSWRALDAAAACGQPLTVRFAALMHALAPDALLAMCERLRVPGDCRDLTRTTATCLPQLAQLQQLDADAVLRLLRDCDALRRPERAAQMLATCDAIAAARQQHWPQSGWLTQMLAAAQAVDAGSVARDCARPRDIPQAVELARSAAIAACRQQLFAGAAAP